MVDLNEKVIFGEQLTDCKEDCYAQNIIELGLDFGLTLKDHCIEGNDIYCWWYGSKKDLIAYVSYYIINMTTQSKEVLKEVQRIIIHKKAEES